jgi:tetratricopeptide (TPR) repeat protein
VNTMTHYVRGGIILVLTLATGCVSMDAHRTSHPEPNARLDQMLELYDQAEVSGEDCKEIWRADNATIDCERILREVERLNLEFPNNKRILMANASLAFSAGRSDKAQFLLDELLAKPGAQPEAAILRSRIALQEGNTTLAHRLIARELMLAPDRADLREAQAANSFFMGDYTDARRHLSMAGRLGTPGWRISYHLGLIAEMEGNWEQACQLYETALEQRPDHRSSVARLAGLGDRPGCETYLRSH